MRRPVLLALALSLPSLTAWAVTKPASPAGIEVDRRGATVESLRTRGESPLTRELSWGAFASQHRGWVARWDRTQGGAARLDGPPTAIPGWSGGILPAGSAASAALAFLRGAEPWVAVDELTHVRTIEDRSGFWVHFNQSHAGVPIWGSRVTVRLTLDGRAVSVVNRSYPGIGIEVAPRAARGSAESEARFGLPADSEIKGAAELMILPIHRTGGPEFRLVWRTELEQQSAHGRWAAYVDAEDGSLLWRHSLNFHADVAGDVTGSIEMVTANGVFEAKPMPYVTVTVRNPDQTTVATAADVNGRYALTTPASAGRELRSSLIGPYGRILDAQANDATPESAVPLADGQPVEADFNWHATTSDASERDSYYHAMIAHDHILLTQPDFTLLDYPMPITVNINDRCNAFWDGTGINFFAAGAPCVNTGQIADVIYHEYAHGITDWQYRPFFPSGAMHEGFSDYYAATITDQPVIGIGFFGPGTDLRRIDEDRVYPDDVVDEVHTDGLIIAGALWDLREQVGKARADSLWHFTRYGYGDNFDDYFADLLLYDAGDGNIYDGTPNFGAITSSFRRHGIGDYGIHVSHAPLRDTENTASSYDFTASFLSVFPLQNAAMLHLRIVSGEAEETLDVPMTATANVREFTHGLAARPAGTVIEYYFTAADTTGTSVAYPEGGATDPFVFQIGPDTTPPSIVHDPMLDQPADGRLADIRAEISDNLDRQIEIAFLYWKRNGGPEQTSFMSPLAGNTFQGFIEFTGLGRGDAIDYRIEAVDRSTAANTTNDPPSGYYTFNLVRGFTRDFEVDNGGLLPSGEWEWGMPVSPISAYSGGSCWGTNIDGAYSNNTTSSLVLNGLDLSAYEVAGLAFRHAILCEPDYDGGVVEASTDGLTWAVLHPDGGYDDNNIISTGKPGFTGGDGSWRLAEFDLSPYLEATNLQLRMRFTSDEGVTGFGWYLDDLQIVERQVYLRPLSLRASGGQGTTVDLLWDAPQLRVVKRIAPVAGYNVYRADDPTATPVRLNTTPITATSYSDAAVTEGQSYYYWVSAVYDTGESRLAGPVEGSAFRPVFALDLEAVAASVDSIGATAERGVRVSNTGSGQLEAEVYVAGETQTIEDVRLRVDLLTVSPDWVTLSTDAVDPVTPDIARLEVRQTSANVRFRITAHSAWGSPTTDFNLLLALDTDKDRDTGFQGAEYFVLAGAFAQAAFQTLAVLVDEEFNPVQGEPLEYVLTSGATTAEFELSKSAIGGPRDANALVVSYGPNPQSLPRDRMPNNTQVSWLTTGATHVSAVADSPITLAVFMNSTGLDYGTYNAKLIFDSNDPTNSTVEVPVSFQVLRPTPILLESWSANAGAEGVVLSWKAGGDLAPIGFHLYRRELLPELSEELRLTESPFAQHSEGEYRFVDLTAEASREYEYRLVEVEADGSGTELGRYRVSTAGLVPESLWLSHAAPNPTRGDAVVRFGLPREGSATLRIFSADGRLVRTLLNGSPRKAGYHVAQWDGRDEARRLLPAGLYFFRLEAGGKTRTEKLLRLK
ncbi:MAG: T9SS type A sorting domain-containing protein [Candidatus Eisenbacteria bacterium]|nr:T9SS type A sorting domain-containing protein [Candidatus Eisenbacteria bacterium]